MYVCVCLLLVFGSLFFDLVRARSLARSLVRSVRSARYTQFGGESLVLEALTAAGVRLKVDPHLFPLEEAAQAMTHLMTNQATGKVLVEILNPQRQ